MAVLEKIRVKFGILIAILIAVALLSFILDPQTLSSASRMLSSENQVGKMDGKAISYQDFYQEYDNYQKVAELLGQSASSEQQQAQLRDAAWQSVFDREVFIPKATKAGLSVSDAEMYDLTQGTKISPVLLQQGMFVDANGNFSREAVANFVQSLDTDETGSSQLYWDFLENNIYRTQLYSKYASLLQASTVFNAAEKANLIVGNNETAEVDFVFVPAGFAADSTVTVSNADIKKYYNEHKHLMKQPANRDFEYVMWEVVPSAADVTATRAAFDEVYEQFGDAENLRNFVTLNSDNKFDTYYYSEAQLESVPEFYDYVKAGAKGVSAVHVEENSFAAARLADTRVMADSAHVFYAAFPIADVAKADSLCAVANAKGITPEFTELGWLTQEVAAANGLTDFGVVFDLGKKATVVKNVNTQAAIVLFVSEKTKAVKKYQLATIVKNVLASDETYRDFQMKAAELADASNGSFEKFSSIVSEQNLPVVPVSNVVESNRRVGVVENARELIRWVFEKGTKVGDVSDVISVDNKYYFVAAVTGIHKEGTATLEEVSASIRNILVAEKTVDNIYKEVSGKVAGKSSLEEVAEALGTTVNHVSGVAFGSSLTQSTDPALTGAASVAQPGQIKVIKGQLGVYAFNVTDKATGSFFSEGDVATAQSRNASYQSSLMQAVIATEADIKDHRAKFF